MFSCNPKKNLKEERNQKKDKTYSNHQPTKRRVGVVGGHPKSSNNQIKDPPKKGKKKPNPKSKKSETNIQESKNPIETHTIS